MGQPGRNESIADSHYEFTPALPASPPLVEFTRPPSPPTRTTRSGLRNPPFLIHPSSIGRVAKWYRVVLLFSEGSRLRLWVRVPSRSILFLLHKADQEEMSVTDAGQGRFAAMGDSGRDDGACDDHPYQPIAGLVNMRLCGLRPPSRAGSMTGNFL